jgi:hypothetical protein
MGFLLPVATYIPNLVREREQLAQRFRGQGDDTAEKMRHVAADPPESILVAGGDNQ